MNSRTAPRAWPLAALIGLLLAAALVLASLLPARALALRNGWPWSAAHPPALVLLLPEQRDQQDPVAQAWLDAAREEGLPLHIWTDDQFVQAIAQGQQLHGMLVPDTLHRQASEVWVQALTRHVEQGGHVLLGFDAALWPWGQNQLSAPVSRLSSLVGCPYAPEPTKGQALTGLSPVLVSPEAAQRLAIQPGKLAFHATPQGEATDGQRWGELSTYGYPRLLYPHLHSDGPCQAKVWMRTPDGEPLLTWHARGPGSVLFANLPLGYLKTRTDGYLLHRLLSYFAGEVLDLPLLSTVPDGLGGLVLNLHVDSNAAEQPMLELERQGWFQRGPFSIHVTAGPDAFAQGDRLGLDMVHNPRMQALLRRLHQQGHEIGNHGGWIHNVFGEGASDHNAERFRPWLGLNQKTLSNIVGEPLRSYSAPMGNHPEWVTDWLREQGLRAYYTAGNSGMGPTRSYQGGQPPAAGSPWAFPISSLESIATLDELPELGWPEARMDLFLEQLARHVSAQGIARLFYFHPASAPAFTHSLQTLQDTTQALAQQGRFRWYGMAELAQFLDRRQAVHWTLSPRDGDMAHLQADSPQSLKGMTWVLPKGSARGLHLSAGQAQIVEDAERWRVIAGDVHHLELRWQHPAP